MGFNDNIYHEGNISKMPDFDMFSLLEIRKRKFRSHGIRKKGNSKRKKGAVKRSNTSLKDLSKVLEDHSRHFMLSLLSSLPISVLRITGPKYRFPSRIDFKKCREEIASALNDFGNRWCKREYVEPDALKEWKVSIFKIVDQRIKFYSQNTNLLPPKPKSTFRHLKQGIQDFHRKYVLVQADKAANNVVVV